LFDMRAANDNAPPRARKVPFLGRIGAGIRLLPPLSKPAAEVVPFPSDPRGA